MQEVSRALRLIVGLTCSKGKTLRFVNAKDVNASPGREGSL